MNEVSLELFEDIKSLGLIINNKLKRNSHIDLKLANSNKICNFLWRNVHFQVKQQCKLLVNRSLILSVLLFSSIAWSPSINSLLRLESFQNEFLNGCQVRMTMTNAWRYLTCFLSATNLFVLMSFYSGNFGTKKSTSRLDWN